MNQSYYETLCDFVKSDNLESFKVKRDENPNSFLENTCSLSHIIIMYNRLSFVKYIMSINNNQQLQITEKIYSQYLTTACMFQNKPIVDYLISLNMFKSSNINTRAFSSSFLHAEISTETQHYNFIGYLYSILPNVDLTSKNTHHLFIYAINKYIVENTLLYLVEWMLSKKPNHYKFNRKLNSDNTETVNYEIFPKKQIRWNSLKTLLFMSQKKPENPHKPTMLWYISNDVVKVISEYVI
jgi:hypothetical protein